MLSGVCLCVCMCLLAKAASFRAVMAVYTFIYIIYI